SDGIDLPVFEEFGPGQAALHLTDDLSRNRLFSDESYRRWFRREYDKKWSVRVWHRDFHDTLIVACPEANLVGRSFGQLADERGVHPVDAFRDLIGANGKKLRWHMTLANHR